MHFDSFQALPLQQMLANEFPFRVQIGQCMPMPKQFFVHVKTGRYRADSIIGYASRNLTKPGQVCLVLSDFDISATKKDKLGKTLEPHERYTDWGVMGLGFCPGKACVVSSFRLQHQNKRLVRERLLKVSMHEIGHNLGLPHCENEKCVMRDAVESIETIDAEPAAFCPDCKEKIGE